MTVVRNITHWCERYKKQMHFAMAATFIWGFFAHGFAFSNVNISHDSLYEFHSEIFGNNIKLGFGRVLTPIYRDLLGSDVTLPWLTGVLALLWIGVAVFLIARIFEIDSKGIIVLIAGICTTNIAVSAVTATYIHDLDSYMFALLCSVAAVFFWRCCSRWWLMGACFIAASLGIYQSFIFVAISLAMMACILDLMEECDFRTVFLNGMKAIGMILLGGCLYYLMMKLMLSMNGAELFRGEYNSLDKVEGLASVNLVELFICCYSDYFYRLINAYSSYPSVPVKAITVVLAGLCMAALLITLLSRKIRLPEKALCVLLVVLLPLGMHMLYILSVGEIHDLMTYPMWMTYVFALLLSDWLFRKYKVSEADICRKTAVFQKAVCLLSVFALLYGNVRFSNGMYVKKALEHDAYLSLMTRIVAQVESMEEYVPGETEVVVVGLPENLNPVMPGFKDYWNVIGMTSPDVICQGSRDRFQMYFDYKMGLPIKLAPEGTWRDFQSRQDVLAMPCYPAPGFLQQIDGILVIRLG